MNNLFTSYNCITINTIRDNVSQRNTFECPHKSTIWHPHRAPRLASSNLANMWTNIRPCLVDFSPKYSIVTVDSHDWSITFISNYVYFITKNTVKFQKLKKWPLKPWSFINVSPLLFMNIITVIFVDWIWMIITICLLRYCF